MLEEWSCFTDMEAMLNSYQGRADAKAQGQDWVKDACEKWVPAKWRNGRDHGHYTRYMQSKKH